MGTKNTMYLLIVGFAIFNCFQFSSCKTLDPVHQWRYIDFNWKSEQEASEALSSGLYNPSVVAPYDVDVHYSQRAGRRIFVALEGRPGVPATLATVSGMTVGSGPLLDPYPDWSWFNNNCSSLISIYRVAIDECDRLWVLDTGNNTCPGKLVVFDLNTDRLIRVISLPTNISGNKDGLSMLTTPIVETSGPRCQNTAVYISDSAGDGLIIYNNGFLARLEHPTFKHDRRDEVFETGPYSINFTAGLLGMSISPRLFPNEPRFLYYRPLVSRGLYAVNSRQIRNFRPGNYLAISGTDRVLSSPGVAQAFSAEGTLFMGLTKELSIICWNRYRTLTSNNIVTIDQDSTTLNYANGIKVIKGPNGEENLWVLSNRFVGFLQGELNFNDDLNFFILTKPVKDLIRGTRCELPAELQEYLRQTANRTQQQTSN